jgi:glycosyltransferase involved in cell wall biosynthesis
MQSHVFKKPSLALVMIVKNEEKGLERAILSCRDFVDEIVIAVDTSSTDKTEEIAKKYATTLKYFDWTDDFSEARNFAHEDVKSDWILFLDGHEYVKASPKLAEHLALDCDGLLCTIEMENGAQFRNPRIYRNGVQFGGAVHELQKMKNVQPYIEFIVKHDRIGGQNISAAVERSAQRDDQVFRIMSLRLKKRKSDIRASFHLGLYFMGRSQYKKAIKYFNQYLRYSKNKPERWFVFFNRAQCHLALNHRFRAFWSASRADDETPDRWEIFKLKGMILFQSRKYFKAIEAFVGSFKINTGDQTYKPWKRDDAGTWNLIGECFFNLRNYYKASVAFKEAWKNCQDPKFKKLLYDRQHLMKEMAKSSR